MSEAEILSNNESFVNNNQSQYLYKIPQIDQLSLQILQKKKYQNLNYNIMLSLPLIVKEKGIYERKQTIQIFKRKKFDATKNPMKKSSDSVKDALLSPGRIYINDFWSDKYQHQILKDSKISEQLASLKGLIRKNVDELVGDVHEVVKNKYGGLSKNLKGLDQMVRKHRQLEVEQRQLEDIDIAKQNFYEFKLNEEKLLSFYKQKLAFRRTSMNNQGHPRSYIDLNKQLYTTTNTDLHMKAKSMPKTLFNEEISQLMEQCDSCQSKTKEEIQTLRLKPWRNNSVPSFRSLVNKPTKSQFNLKLRNNQPKQ